MNVASRSIYIYQGFFSFFSLIPQARSRQSRSITSQANSSASTLVLDTLFVHRKSYIYVPYVCIFSSVPLSANSSSLWEQQREDFRALVSPVTFVSDKLFSLARACIVPQATRPTSSSSRIVLKHAVSYDRLALELDLFSVKPQRINGNPCKFWPKKV